MTCASRSLCDGWNWGPEPRLAYAIAGADILPESRPLLSNVPRLPGTDGRKASKSLNNAISLTATHDEIARAVNSMHTNPEHHVVLVYLEAFDPDVEGVAELKTRYAEGER